MAYELHIERDEPIELHEWEAAVDASTSVRPHEAPSSTTNPNTGEVLSIPTRSGGASVNIDGQWIPIFYWHMGQISFKAPESTAKSDPVMGAALALAATLSASICGDEGEVYDGSL
jgi:hypothetical protein